MDDACAYYTGGGNPGCRLNLYIAPGRVILGLGTGYTGRDTMGLPKRLQGEAPQCLKEIVQAETQALCEKRRDDYITGLRARGP